MSVYASAPAFAQTHRHPKALILIVGAHTVLIGAVMTAKLDLPAKFERTITEVTLVEPPKPPPPEPPPEPAKPRNDPTVSRVDRPLAILPIPSRDGPIVDTTPVPLPDPGPLAGTNPDPAPFPNQIPAIVHTGPRFATPDWAVKPPYPDDKRRQEEEAVLKLRLSIDERGRVVAVEPVGRADRSFLDAARRHLTASWRYKPATEDGRPVASSTVITLRFELE
jgi:protein TonB